MTTHFNGSSQNNKSLGKIYENKQPRPSNQLHYYYEIHDGAQGDPKKWSMPGWRIEQAYSKSCLIGNWCEERNTFDQNNVGIESTNRADFTDDVINQTPCTQLRRHAMRRNDGTTDKYQVLDVNRKQKRNTNYISWYDSDYRRVQDKATRKWNRHKLVWEPEWSDHPVQGKPTQLGIRQTKFKKWAEDGTTLSNSCQWKPKTTNSVDYNKFDKSAFPLRYAQAPKHLSSKMNAISRTNKSLPLRDRMPLLCPPERQPNVAEIEKNVTKMTT